MSKSRFADLLTTAVRTIAAREHKTIAGVQDELGYMLGREGGSCIEYWRKGHIPAEIVDLTTLTQTLAQRGGLNLIECEQFLQHGNHPHPKSVLSQLPRAIGREAARLKTQWHEFSPFVAGPPITLPHQFFNRERELRRIFDLWRRFPMQHVAVIGPKRSGKTSLLHQVYAITRTPATELRPNQCHDWLPHPEQYRWVLVDFQDARMQERERLLHYLLSQLNYPIPTPCTLDAFMDIVSRHLQNPTVILMDEIGAGLASPELDEPFWWSLRSLVSTYATGNLAFLITAHEHPMSLADHYGKPSPFFNIFHTLSLGPFPEASARELIASSPRPFSSDDVTWIIKTSECWPCLLQILCQVRLTALEEGNTSNAWKEEGLWQIEAFRS
ncbi:MAG: ATP-binding protein [Anaerolineae bacterium]|nr:ATP-binding protein [Anaerolineae bacterium]